MGGTRTMAVGFNPTMADGHPSGGGLRYSKVRRGRRPDFPCRIFTALSALLLLSAFPYSRHNHRLPYFRDSLLIP